MRDSSKLSTKAQTQKPSDALMLWQPTPPAERAQDFQNWVAQLPKPTPGITLPDEAFDRTRLYEQ